MHVRLLFAALFAVLLGGQTSPAPDAVQPPKPASVAGRTVSNSGQPLKKTALTLRPVLAGPGQLMPTGYTTTSDAEGNFTFEAVDAGRYILSADKPGYQRQTYGARKGGSGNTILALTSGQVMSALKLEMSPQILISGKVLDADGDPVGKSQVRASRMSFYNGKRQLSAVGYAQTDENGEYKIQSLGPGKYYLSAIPAREQFFGQTTRSAAAPPPAGQPAKQEEAAVTTFYPGVTDSSSAQLIELTAGHDRAGTNITLRKSSVFHVKGKLAGAVPTDKATLRVMLMGRSSLFFDFGTNASATIEKDGSFDLFPVAPGGYNLMLAAIMGQFKSLGMAPVDVANRDLEGVALTAESPYDLSGQVTTEKNTDTAAPDPAKQNTPQGPTRLNLQPLDGQMMMNSPGGSTADDGTFTLANTSPGRYRVNVNGKPEGTYLKSIRFGDQDVLANGLTVPPGNSSTRLEVMLGANAAKVEGVVQDAEGKPLSSTIVTLLSDPAAPDRSDLYQQANTDQNGKFSMKGIAPGKYRVYAWDELEYGNQFDPEYMKNYETKGTKLDLAASGAEQVTLKSIKQ